MNELGYKKSREITRNHRKFGETIKISALQLWVGVRSFPSKLKMLTNIL